MCGTALGQLWICDTRNHVSVGGIGGEWNSAPRSIAQGKEAILEMAEINKCRTSPESDGAVHRMMVVAIVTKKVGNGGILQRISAQALVMLS